MAFQKQLELKELFENKIRIQWHFESHVAVRDGVSDAFELHGTADNGRAVSSRALESALALAL